MEGKEEREEEDKMEGGGGGGRGGEDLGNILSGGQAQNKHERAIVCLLERERDGQNKQQEKPHISQLQSEHGHASQNTGNLHWLRNNPKTLLIWQHLIQNIALIMLQ